MLELYNYKLSTCSQKVRLCLAEKSLEWVDKEIDLSTAEQLSEEYLEINPNGVVPTLVHDGNIVIDSSVIMEYLDEAYPDSGTRLSPQGALDRATMRAWMRYIEEVPTVSIRYPSFNRLFVNAYKNLSKEEFENIADNSPLRKNFLHAMGQDGFSDAEETQALERLSQTIARVDTAVTEHPWLCGGDYSIADICLTPTIVRMEDLGLSHLWDDAPNFSAWFDRIKARPSFNMAFYEGSRINISDWTNPRPEQEAS